MASHLGGPHQQWLLDMPTVVTSVLVWAQEISGRLRRCRCQFGSKKKKKIKDEKQQRQFKINLL